MSPARRRRDPLGLDPALAERWLRYVRDVLWPYFRPQVIGTEHLPRGRGLIIGCHSGVIPYDAAAILVAIHAATGRLARSIGDRFFGQVGFIERFLRRQGALVGSPAVLEAVLPGRHLALLFPGGARDMERPYLSQRYRVLPHRGFAPGHGGYVKAALRTRSPIVPVAVVGAEEAHVMLGNMPRIARAVGMPLFPVLLFPFPLPVKLYIRFAAPSVLPGTPRDADDQPRVDALNRMVRRRLQALIDDTVRHRRGVLFDSHWNGRLPGAQKSGRGA